MIGPDPQIILRASTLVYGSAHTIRVVEDMYIQAADDSLRAFMRGGDPAYCVLFIDAKVHWRVGAFTAIGSVAVLRRHQAPVRFADLLADLVFALDFLSAHHGVGYDESIVPLATSIFSEGAVHANTKPQPWFHRFDRGVHRQRVDRTQAGPQGLGRRHR